MIYYCSIQAQSTALPTPRAMVCCLKLLSATFGNAEVFHAPMGWWKASTMFFGADAFNQSIGAWNMSAVTNMGGCSMLLLPPPSRLVPGTHQQWLVRWWNSTACFVYNVWNKVTWHTIHVLPSTYVYCTWFIVVVFRRKVQLSQLLVLWFAVWSCFQQPLAMLKCSMPQWAGGRQAPCSLVLMPSTSPLGPGTCQQWPPSNRCFCWSSLELKSLNDLTTWCLRLKGWLQLTPTVHTTKDWWTSHVGMQSVLALSKWLGGFLFMSFMYANVTL